MDDAGPIESALPADAGCLGCGYALQGLVEPACPECGRGFDPADKSTFSRRSGRGGFWRWCAAGPGWVIVAGAVVAAGLLLYADSVPGGFFGWFILGFMLGNVFAILWGVRLLVALILNAYDRTLREVAVRYWKRWLLPVLVVVLAQGAVIVNAPERLRFALARPVLEVEANNVLNHQPARSAFTARGTRIDEVYTGRPIGGRLLRGWGGFHGPRRLGVPARPCGPAEGAGPLAGQLCDRQPPRRGLVCGLRGLVGSVPIHPNQGADAYSNAWLFGRCQRRYNLRLAFARIDPM